MKKKITILLLIIILTIQAIIPIKVNAFVETDSTPAIIDKYQMEDVESPTTGLNLITGIMMEPTVKFFTFIIDAVMSVFSSFMTQSDDVQPVMVSKDEINTLPNLGPIGATYTLPREPYENALDSIESLKYPNFTFSAEDIFGGNIDLLDVNFISQSNNDKNWLSVRKVVSQWYQVLRMITIVGLLSVLIYTGIKIIISSSSQDKAKHKEMIVNWFIAVVLAFSMHYIMAFILSIVEEIMGLMQGITGAVQVNIDGTTFTTNLIGLARFQMQQQHFTAKVGHLIIYTALVVYTFKFTFIYFKRVLKMAFLTIMAPIVALTYPIDKINDGKAQGFELWLKEFIFNALLQPMHYLLYYILVSSSLTLAVRNPVYAIVALAFMSQAEKLLKTIFGFGKARAGTVGGIAGAFTTGAVTSSLIKHVRDPLHPFGGGKSNNKSRGGIAGNTNYYNEETVNFYDDTTSTDDLLGFVDNSNIPRPNSDSGGSFAVPSSMPRTQMLEMIDAYEMSGGDLGDIPDLSTLNNLELRNLIQDRIIDNGGADFAKDFIQNGRVIFCDENKSAWDKFKEEHAFARGITNVGKTLAKPIWDSEKSKKENVGRLFEKSVKGVVGATVGVAAAAVQAGVSITDVKYNPIESASTVAAGMAGTSAVIDKITNKKELDPEDKKSLEKYTEQWFNRDDIINNYKTEYGGDGKKRRTRAAKNYVSRGITDFTEQKQAMNFADLIQRERGLDEDEADKVAVATLQYRQGLTRTNNYMVLFDKKKRNRYTDLQADAYVGSASKASVKLLHESLIDNVLDFDRANR